MTSWKKDIAADLTILGTFSSLFDSLDPGEPDTNRNNVSLPLKFKIM